MQVEESTVRHLRITGADRLDPISVTLQDFGPGQGKITIDVWGEAWACYWGAMGEKKTISSFFQKASIGYLAEKLAPGLSQSRFSGEKLRRAAKKEILLARRLDEISHEEARDLFDDVEFRLENVETLNDCGHHDSFMSSVFGDNWMESVGHGDIHEPNPPYTYLCRVIEAVKAGLALWESGNRGINHAAQT